MFSTVGNFGQLGDLFSELLSKGTRMAKSKTTAKDRITAKQIVGLLATKHSDDMFIPECKDGPTITADAKHVRMDGWVMPRSWAKPATTGYEIKVTKQDFRQDTKWQRYLPLCHHLYFVCPWGMIKPEEIHEGVGLMWVTRTATKIYIKVKAPYRDITIPENLWRYVLMCRSTIRDERKFDSVGFWRDWLKEKIENQKLGHMVSKRIKAIVETAEAEAYGLRQMMKTYDTLREALREQGITSDDAWRVESQAIRKITEHQDRVPRHLIRQVELLQEHNAKALSELNTELAKLNDPKTQPATTRALQLSEGR